MGIPREIEIGEGNNGKVKYYYWSEYDGYEEAIQYGKKIKEERRRENMKIKYFILKSQDGWFLPVPKFVLYLNKDLRLI